MLIDYCHFAPTAIVLRRAESTKMFRLLGLGCFLVQGNLAQKKKNNFEKREKCFSGQSTPSKCLYSR